MRRHYERLPKGCAAMKATYSRPSPEGGRATGKDASYLRGKEPGDFLYDLESYARRSPEVVFGGLFVVGLAAARFLKASRKRPRHTGPPEPIGDAGSPELSAAAPSSATSS